MNAQHEVESLLGDMRAAVLSRDVRKFDQASDRMHTLVMAYAQPTIDRPFKDCSLTKGQQRIADLLFSRLGKETSIEAIIGAMYFDRPEGEPDTAENVMSVFITRMRKKLAGSGYGIETIWGRGFRMVKGAAGPTYPTMCGPGRHRTALQD